MARFHRTLIPVYIYMNIYNGKGMVGLVCINIYIYIYIYTVREREKRERVREGFHRALILYSCMRTHV